MSDFCRLCKTVGLKIRKLRKIARFFKRPKLRENAAAHDRSFPQGTATSYRTVSDADGITFRARLVGMKESGWPIASRIESTLIAAEAGH